MSIGNQNLLITGATSQVGAYAVKALLEKPSSRLFLLVRKQPKALDVKARIQAVLSSIGASTDDEKRIRVIPGDLTRRQLGIRDQHFDELCQEGIDQVIHLASFTDRENLSQDSLLTTNYEGLQRLLNLSKRLKVKVFNHLGWLHASDSEAERSSGEADDHLRVFSLVECVHRMCFELVERRSRDDDFSFRIIHPGFFLDEESFDGVHRRWYFRMLETLCEIAEAYRKNAQSSPTRIRLPSTSSLVYVTSPRFVGEFIASLVTHSPRDSNQSYRVFERVISIKDLLERVVSARPGLEIDWLRHFESLPSIERRFFLRSFVFSHYLTDDRIFSRDERVDALSASAGIRPSSITGRFFDVRTAELLDQIDRTRKGLASDDMETRARA